MSLPRLHAVLVLTLALLVVLVLPGPARAANSVAYDDWAGDAVYPGLDIQRVALSYGDDGLIGIGANTDLVIGGNRLTVYLDVDRSTTTGWYGYDYMISYERYITGQWAGLAGWNGASFTVLAAPTLSWVSGEKAVAIFINRSDIGWPLGVNVLLRGFHATGVDGPDWAPDQGSFGFDFGLNTEVGGVSGPGVQDTPAPLVPELTTAEARSAARTAATTRLGGTTKVGLGACPRLTGARIRCATVATRGVLTWKGSSTVTERPSTDGTFLVQDVTFVGKRIDRRCLRKATTRAARARCSRAARWSW